jgi:hypothetical protein
MTSLLRDGFLRFEDGVVFVFEVVIREIPYGKKMAEIENMKQIFI